MAAFDGLVTGPVGFRHCIAVPVMQGEVSPPNPQPLLLPTSPSTVFPDCCLPGQHLGIKPLLRLCHDDWPDAGKR